MIGVDKKARGAFTAAVLACLLVLAGCHGDSTDETTPGTSSYTTTFFGTIVGYTISGAISGVPSGEPVTVRNRMRDPNGAIVSDDRLVLNTDTSFVFPTPVPSGYSYAITIHDEPANLACSVGGGSGVMGSTNISGVSVSCSTVPTFSVGGPVSGLIAGGQLILQNNGSGNLLLNDTDSSFAFTVGDTKSYQITVYDKPANQNCTVANGSGMVSGVNISNISVSCVTDNWTHPANLTDPTTNISPNGQDAIDPQVAMDDNGNAIAVWQQNDGANTQIYMSDYNLTSPNAWAHPANLAATFSAAGTNAHSPQVAMDNNGNAIVVWLQELAGEDRVYRRDYRGGSWGAIAEISPPPLNNRHAEDPRVAMDDSNNAIVVWRQPDGVGQPQLFMSDYNLTAAGLWTNPANNNAIFSIAGQEVRHPPDVAMGRNGADDDAVIVWRQYSGTGAGNFRVYMREYRAGVWSAVPALGGHINPAGTGGLTGPKVEMDDIGNTIIVWDQANTESQPHPYFPGSGTVYIQQIYKSEYRAGVWTNPANLADNISPDGLNAAAPKVAMDNNGDAIIAWIQSDPSFNTQLFKSEYRTAAWTDPASLSDNFSPDGEGVANHDLAMNDNGNAIITWRQFDGEKHRVYKSEYSAAAWTHPVSLADAISPEVPDSNDCNSSDPNITNCFPASVSTGPAVAMDNSAAPGDALIIWSQSDHKVSTTPIYQQIFMSEQR